jgi:flagellar basal-body rod protein FlgC
MDLMQAMKISGTGLTSQRAKINIISENLANSDTTRTESGEPYRRKMVVFSEQQMEPFKSILAREESEGVGVEVADIVESGEEFPLVYNPAHPDADPETGNVKMPNVDIVTEMADMMVAKRAYDANVTAMNNAKSMMLRALEIGK